MPRSRWTRIDKEEGRRKNYHLEITVFPSHPPFFDYFSLLTDGGRPQPLCLTLPPDAHADFATLYVICAHCNLLSVRIERVFRRPTMIRNQFRHSIYPGISKRIAWQKKRRMWKIAESRNERTKIPRRIEILCRDYRNIITRKIRLEEEGKRKTGKRTLRNLVLRYKVLLLLRSLRVFEAKQPTRANDRKKRLCPRRVKIRWILAPLCPARLSLPIWLLVSPAYLIRILLHGPTLHRSQQQGRLQPIPLNNQHACRISIAQRRRKKETREDRLSRRAISRLYNFPRSLVHPGHGRSSDRTSRPLNGHLKQFDSTTSSIELPQTSNLFQTESNQFFRCYIHKYWFQIRRRDAR